MQFIYLTPKILESTFNRRKQIASNSRRAEVEFTCLAPSVCKMKREKISINSIASFQPTERLGPSFRNVITLIHPRILTGRGTITNTDLEISRLTFGSEMISFTSKSANCQRSLKRFFFLLIDIHFFAKTDS